MERAGEEVLDVLGMRADVEDVLEDVDFLDLFFFLTRPLTFMERRFFLEAVEPSVDVLVSIGMMDIWVYGWMYLCMLLLEGEIEWMEEVFGVVE